MSFSGGTIISFSDFNFRKVVILIIDYIIKENHFNSPLWIFEYKFPELKVPQYNARPMAGGDGRSHLSEESPGFRLPQVSLGPNMGVQIPMASRKDHIRACPANNYLFDLVYVQVGFEAEMTVQDFTIHLIWHNLEQQTRFTFSFMNAKRKCAKSS